MEGQCMTESDSSRGSKSLELSSQSFQLDNDIHCDISYLLSTPTKMTCPVSATSTPVDVSCIDMLNTPKKDVPESSTLPFHSFIATEGLHGGPSSLYVIAHTTPTKRRLAPKIPSVPTGSNVSPLLKKYRKISQKRTPTKLKFILPKQRQIKIKRRVLKSKPPIESTTILESSIGDVEDVWATPFPEELFKEIGNEQFCDKNSVDEEEDDVLGELEEDEEDNINTQQEEHLAALFKASSTIAEKCQNEKKNSSGQKVNTQQRRLQARIAALQRCENEQEVNTNIAVNFLRRAKEILIQQPAVFNKLICTLQEFDSSRDMPENLYLQVDKIVKNFPAIVSDFVMFLKPHQALRVGRYTDYCVGLRLRDFVQKLQQIHGGHQLQIQKLLKVIQIMQSKDAFSKDLEDMKAKVGPVLRYPHLLENFAQCFSSEPPPPSLNNDYEDVDLGSSETPDSYEHINIVDDDQFETPERPCIYGCQNSSQAKPNHCRSCSVRFIDGRVYLQNGRTVRPAKVTYLFDKTDKREAKSVNVKSKTTRRPKNFQVIKETKL